MSLYKFAEHELDLIGLTDEDEINSAMRKHILSIIKIFADEGHSGLSAAYAISVLDKLLRFEPLTPLTGEDDEWTDVAEMNDGKPLFQNKRCSRIFKDDSGSYDVEGIVFHTWEMDEDGNPYQYSFTNSDSRVYITFPYVPTTLFEEVKNEGEEQNDGDEQKINLH